MKRLVLALACLWPGLVGAATVDVDFMPQTSGGGGNPNGVQFQTFTPGVTGFLTQLDLRLFRGGNVEDVSGVEISILTTTDGVPDVRGTGTLFELSYLTEPLGVVSRGPIEGGPGPFDATDGAFESFDFSGQGVALQAGSLYAIMVAQTDTVTTGLFWGGKSEGGVGAYPDGQQGSLGYTSSSFTEPNMDEDDRSDFVFRTYMHPAVIPVPPAFALLPLALAGLVCLRGRGGGRGTADRRGAERGGAA